MSHSLRVWVSCLQAPERRLFGAAHGQIVLHSKLIVMVAFGLDL